MESSTDTQESTRRKESENKRINIAFVIIPSNFVEGVAFDPDIQEQSKKNRLPSGAGRESAFCSCHDSRDGDRVRGGEKADRRGDCDDNRWWSRDKDRERYSKESRERCGVRDSVDCNRYQERSYQDAHDDRRIHLCYRDRVRNSGRDHKSKRERDLDRDRRRDLHRGRESDRGRRNSRQSGSSSKF